ncbi:ferritin-like domain-containing protein [Peribacillus alkalitolerans]|uniref:ferritin-like domain-containing protein n=1 Tax=Peribacillus alkalitolerans TaxID=1550385 RepID=UPI0013D1A88E|nr:ferritin-like domain-containing protein [Peribacillus alkalitolerans]
MQNENQTIIDELNGFLKGQYMGIHAYEHFIQNTDEHDLKRAFQKIQQEHKFHTMRVAERIQNLGGTPVTDEGIVGTVSDFINKFITPSNRNDLIKKAIVGEGYYGISLSEKMALGDLDPESNRMVQEIIDRDYRHLTTLNSLLH